MSEKNANLQGKGQGGVIMNMSPSNTGAGTPADQTQRALDQLTLAKQGKGLVAAIRQRPLAYTCQQSLKISVFFDGTGNNLKADLHTLEHSNVARMFRAMPMDDEASGVFSRYVPGIGTLFPQIGDNGKGEVIDTHNAMGAMGQARLDWASKEVQRIITDAETRAKNPTNKIVMISLAVFGFSRGATLARAFVRDLLKVQGGKCTGSSKILRWKQGNHPTEISFLGLWDTVAAVGIPIGANNLSAVRRQRLSLGNEVRALVYGDQIRMLRAVDLAFGAPGADPSKGPMNGHAAWGDGLHIPEEVTSCVHMVAAHELRNSFPLDSVARNSVKPGNCKEIVYPGVHSDVGGGYRPGEGGRGKGEPMDSAVVADGDKLLSLIPLKAMYDEALAAGVPLRKVGSKEWTKDNINDFDADPDMEAAFDHYMDVVGRGTRTIGAAFLTHTRLYLAWRFHHIREKQAIRPDIEKQSADKKTGEERSIESNEEVWAQDERKLDAEINNLKAEEESLKRRRLNEQLALSRSGRGVDPITLLPTPQGQQMAAAINTQYGPKIESLQAKIAELLARKETLPSQGTLTKGLSEYDALLLEDVRSILAMIEKNPKLRAQLRPHYKNLVETYENEYVHKRGLDKTKEGDIRIIEFFDNYVHDSLSDFGRDSTLASDPRVIYAGGDEKIKFAQNQPAVVLERVSA